MLRNLTIFSVLALCALLSCQKSAEPEADTVKVNLEIVSPDGVVAKSEIGDGTKAVKLYYTAFINGNPIPSLNREVDLSGGRTTLNLTLVKNVVYDFIFWAQSPDVAGQEPMYDLTSFYSDGKVRVNYNVSANNDNRDAFYARRPIDTSSPDLSPVLLQRPFAQINFAAADYDELKYMELHTALESGAVINGLPDVLDCCSGEVSSSTSDGTYVNASFLSAAVPSGEDEYVTVSNTRCGYVGMNYVLSSEDGETITLTADFKSGDSEWSTGLVTNIPIERNHKTFIFGNFFVEQTILDIIILPGFEDEDGNPNDDENIEI